MNNISYLKICFLINFICLLCGCKRKTEIAVPSGGNSTFTPIETGCSWLVTKKEGDNVNFSNGFLNIISKHAISERRHTFTSVTSTCSLTGDFDLKIEIPYLALSDSGNKGSIGTMIYSASNKNLQATLGARAASIGSDGFPPRFMPVFQKPTSALFSYKRTGVNLTGKLFFGRDSLVFNSPNFGIEPLYLVLNALCDSSAKMPTEARIDRIVINAANGSLKTDELSTGTLK